MRPSAKFVVPSDSTDWPEDLWGIKLGSITSNIRTGHSCKHNREELVAIGFDFSDQKRKS